MHWLLPALVSSPCLQALQFQKIPLWNPVSKVCSFRGANTPLSCKRKDRPQQKCFILSKNFCQVNCPLYRKNEFDNKDCVLAQENLSKRRSSKEWKVFLYWVFKTTSHLTTHWQSCLTSAIKPACFSGLFFWMTYFSWLADVCEVKTQKTQNIPLYSSRLQPVCLVLQHQEPNLRVNPLKLFKECSQKPQNNQLKILPQHMFTDVKTELFLLPGSWHSVLTGGCTECVHGCECVIPAEMRVSVAVKPCGLQKSLQGFGLVSAFHFLPETHAVLISLKTKLGLVWWQSEIAWNYLFISFWLIA